jgi:hypothetical protein
MSSFQNVLLAVQSELKNSVELMRRNASMETSGVAAFKLRHDVPRYEAAYNQFQGLQVNAREIEKGLNTLAMNIPRAAQGCAPPLIPPLFSHANAAVMKVPPRTPIVVAPTVPREPPRTKPTRFWGW